MSSHLFIDFEKRYFDILYRKYLDYALIRMRESGSISFSYSNSDRRLFLCDPLFSFYYIQIDDCVMWRFSTKLPKTSHLISTSSMIPLTP